MESKLDKKADKLVKVVEGYERKEAIEMVKKAEIQDLKQLISQWVESQLNEKAENVIKDISLEHIQKEKYGEVLFKNNEKKLDQRDKPKKINSRYNDIENKGDSPLKHTQEYTEEKSITRSCVVTLGVDIGTSFSIDAVFGSADVSLDVSASYERATATTNTSSHKSSLETTVPGRSAQEIQVNVYESMEAIPFSVRVKVGGEVSIKFKEKMAYDKKSHTLKKPSGLKGKYTLEIPIEQIFKVLLEKRLANCEINGNEVIFPVEGHYVLLESREQICVGETKLIKGLTNVEHHPSSKAQELEIIAMDKNAQISHAINCPVLIFNIPKDIWEKDEETFAKWLRANKANAEVAKSLGVTKITAMGENARIDSAVNSPVVAFGTNEISFSVPEDFFSDVNQLKEHIKLTKEKEHTPAIINNPAILRKDSLSETAHYSSPLSQPLPQSQQETRIKSHETKEEETDSKKFLPHT